MYAHGLLKHNSHTGEYKFFHYEKSQSEDVLLSNTTTSTTNTTPFLVSSGKNHFTSFTQWVYSTFQSTANSSSYDGGSSTLQHVEFHEPSYPEKSILQMNMHDGSMTVEPGCDLMESICIWCALCILLGDKNSLDLWEYNEKWCNIRQNVTRTHACKHIAFTYTMWRLGIWHSCLKVLCAG